MLNYDLVGSCRVFRANSTYFEPEYCQVTHKFSFKDFKGYFRWCESPEFCEICYAEDECLMLRCERCGLSVHTYCCGYEEYCYPWMCSACVKYAATHCQPSCFLCGKSTGALVKFQEVWAHSVCSVWLRNVRFLGSKLKVDCLLPEKKCCYCKELTQHYLDCFECNDSFHAYCGQRHGVVFFESEIVCFKHKLPNPSMSALRNKLRKFYLKEKTPPVTPNKTPKKRKSLISEEGDCLVVQRPQKKRKLEKTKETKFIQTKLTFSNAFVFDWALQNLTNFSKAASEQDLESTLVSYLENFCVKTPTHYDFSCDLRFSKAFKRQSLPFEELQQELKNHIKPANFKYINS